VFVVREGGIFDGIPERSIVELFEIIRTPQGVRNQFFSPDFLAFSRNHQNTIAFPSRSYNELIKKKK
jgi:hypothetical protein